MALEDHNLGHCHSWILGHEFSERPTLNVQQAISYLEGCQEIGRKDASEGSRADGPITGCL